MSVWLACVVGRHKNCPGSDPVAPEQCDCSCHGERISPGAAREIGKVPLPPAQTASNRTPVCARYLMYDNPERTKAWRLDVENDGQTVKFWVNGEPKIAPKQAEADVLRALTALDTAFGQLMMSEG